MTAEEATRIAVEKLARIAPEADIGQLPRDTNLREALDLDSMDFLNWVTALATELRIDIPESDYPKLATLRACGKYLANKTGSSV